MKLASSSSLGFLLVICLLNRNAFVTSQALTASVSSYAPVYVTCPERPLVRLAGSATQKNQTLSPGEQAFLRGRRALTAPLWRNFFMNGPGKATGYQSTSLMASGQLDWPVLGIAHSGGGERATLYAAGVIQALDSRTASSPIGGVYQLASYSTALSGGSWLLSAMASSNYPTIPDLIPQLNLQTDVVLPGGFGLKTFLFFENILSTAVRKLAAGFQISITDIWAAALGYHFSPGAAAQSHGTGVLFSSLQNTASVKKFQNPLPIIVSNHQPLAATAANPAQLPVQGTPAIPLSAPIYENSPFEFGSYDPQLSAFTPTQFLGTSLQSGKPVQKNACVQGFDQLNFIMATSSSIANMVLSGGLPGIPLHIGPLIKQFIQQLSLFGVNEPLSAHYPNPFRGVNGPTGFDRTNSDELYLVDGGENGENIPLNPLLAPARQIDVIMAADASSDSQASDPHGSGWPNGASMINTWLRVYKTLPAGAANFPPVPLDPKVWYKQGLSTRPTFFGCNAPSKRGNGGYPLVIYLPNTPTSQAGYFTNTSTYQMQYSKAQTSSFINSVFNSTTMPRFGSTVDIEWSTCLSCALIDRSRNRLNVARSAACEKCFARYCYQDATR